MMKKLGILVVMLVAALVGGALPATAQSDTVRDRRGDMPAALDLVKLRANNGERKVRAVLHVRDLRAGDGRFELGVSWEDRNIAYAYFARVRATDEGLTVRFKRSKEGNDVDPVWTCAQRRATLAYLPEEDRIILTVPHRCLRSYDYYKVINDWSFYGSTYRQTDGTFQYDAIRTDRLRRG